MVSRDNSSSPHVCPSAVTEGCTCVSPSGSHRLVSQRLFKARLREAVPLPSASQYSRQAPPHRPGQGRVARVNGDAALSSSHTPSPEPPTLPPSLSSGSTSLLWRLGGQALRVCSPPSALLHFFGWFVLFSDIQSPPQACYYQNRVAVHFGAATTSHPSLTGSPVPHGCPSPTPRRPRLPSTADRFYTRFYTPFPPNTFEAFLRPLDSKPQSSSSLALTDLPLSFWVSISFYLIRLNIRTHNAFLSFTLNSLSPDLVLEETLPHHRGGLWTPFPSSLWACCQGTSCLQASVSLQP